MSIDHNRILSIRQQVRFVLSTGRGEMPKLTPDELDLLCSAALGLVVALPIPMVLHCPHCHVQHIDAPEPETGWMNPPHESHLCHECGAIWRPASVPTTGVESVPAGKNDRGPQSLRPDPLDDALNSGSGVYRP